MSSFSIKKYSERNSALIAVRFNFTEEDSDMFNKLIFFPIILSLCYMVYYYDTLTKNNDEYDELTEIEKCYFNCEYNYSPISLANFTSYKNTDIFNQSTCSESATLRGTGQKIITFSYYGNVTNKRGYFKGIANNLELLDNIYPGWTVRVYHNIRIKYDSITLCKLQCKYKDSMDICFVGNLPIYGNIMGGNKPKAWRFIGLADPLVDIMISRDLDSFINERESAAVNEWIKKYPNISLHVMRDYPIEHETEILGGMWGAKINLKRKLFKDISENILSTCSVESNGDDQTCLKNYLWSIVSESKDILAHDSYSCENERFKIGVVLGFPTQRNMKIDYSFVGSRYNIQTDKFPLTKQCPEACRRNKTWIYC